MSQEDNSLDIDIQFDNTSENMKILGSLGVEYTVEQQNFSFVMISVKSEADAKVVRDAMDIKE